MPFEVVSGVGRRMGVLDGGGDRRRERSCSVVNLGRPIVTNGDFVAKLCKMCKTSPNDFGEVLLILTSGLSGPHPIILRYHFGNSVH